MALRQKQRDTPVMGGQTVGLLRRKGLHVSAAAKCPSGASDQDSSQVAVLFALESGFIEFTRHFQVHRIETSGRFKVI
jgi:hypothetical protein